MEIPATVRRGLLIVALGLMACVPGHAAAQEPVVMDGPVVYLYSTTPGGDLKAFVFSPCAQAGHHRRAAIVLFHGGGWSTGEPEWAFARARHFADRGMIAVAAQYRLSDQDSITPIEAMADARAVIQWMRAHADSLDIDPGRIAAYGWSAGGHLAVCAAIFDDSSAAGNVSSAPNALVLVSPAVSVGSDGWFQRLLGKRAAGNICELQVYEDFGHLFTPKGIPDDGWPQPDPETAKAAAARADEFLISIGFMEVQSR